MDFWLVVLLASAASGCWYVSRGHPSRIKSNPCSCLFSEPRQRKKLLRLLRKRRGDLFSFSNVRAIVLVSAAIFCAWGVLALLLYFWNRGDAVVAQVEEISRDNLGERKSCRHTVENPLRVVDEYGRICSPFDLNSSDGGCCPRAPDSEISGCALCSNNRGQCCNTYENCVSCCILNSSSTSASAALAKDGGRDVTTPPVEGKLRGFWLNRNPLRGSRRRFLTVRQHTDSDVDILKHRQCFSSNTFDACSCRCRVDSSALHHENSYADAYNYCFTHAPPPPLEPNHVIGSVGQSCDAACSVLGLRCDEHAIFRSNRCEVLKSVRKCISGCELGVGSDRPSFASDGRCFLNGNRQFISCSGRNTGTSRLCSCSAR